MKKTHIHRTLRAGTNCGTRESPHKTWPRSFAGRRTNGIFGAPDCRKKFWGRANQENRAVKGTGDYHPKTAGKQAHGSPRGLATRCGKPDARALTATLCNGGRQAFNDAGRRRNHADHAFFFWKTETGSSVHRSNAREMHQLGTGRGQRRKLSRRRGLRGSAPRGARSGWRGAVIRRSGAGHPPQRPSNDP